MRDVRKWIRILLQPRLKPGIVERLVTVVDRDDAGHVGMHHVTSKRPQELGHVVGLVRIATLGVRGRNDSVDPWSRMCERLQAFGDPTDDASRPGTRAEDDDVVAGADPASTGPPIPEKRRGY